MCRADYKSDVARRNRSDRRKQLGEIRGNAPERDETEKCILDMALENNISVYGFCWGMKVIADYFGWDLAEV